MKRFLMITLYAALACVVLYIIAKLVMPLLVLAAGGYFVAKRMRQNRVERVTEAPLRVNQYTGEILDDETPPSMRAQQHYARTAQRPRYEEAKVNRPTAWFDPNKPGGVHFE